MAKHTRSELRTLKTKANEGLRIAKQVMDGIAMIRNPLAKNTTRRQVADQCFNVAENAYNQQLAVVNELQAEIQEVGTYSRDKKQKQTQA